MSESFMTTLEELEEYLKEQKIPYDKHTEGKYEYSAEWVFYRPDINDAATIIFPSDQEEGILVSVYDIEKTIELAKENNETRDQLVARLYKLTGKNIRGLPPFSVADE